MTSDLASLVTLFGLVRLSSGALLVCRGEGYTVYNDERDGSPAVEPRAARIGSP